MRFKDFIMLEMANPKKGLVDQVVKVKLTPDDNDRDLFMRFSATYPDEQKNILTKRWLDANGIKKPSRGLAAKVVRAKYAICAASGPGSSDHIQRDAESDKVYFVNPKENAATLKVGGNEIYVTNMGFSTLKHRLENYPLGNGETGNVKKDMPRFTHPTVLGKFAELDSEGKPIGKVQQTNGINEKTLGISGHKSQLGWSLAYHKTGVATKALTDEEKKDVNKKSSIDLSKSIPDNEKLSLKKLTVAGNNFIDNVLFNPEEITTDLTDEDGNKLTNKEILQHAKKVADYAVRRDKSLDSDDVIKAFAMLLRNKYGATDKYPDAYMMINDLVKNAIYDVKGDMGIGRKAGDVAHGKQYGLKTSTLDTDSEDPAMAKMRMPTKADLSRRLDLSKPEYKGPKPEAPEQAEDIPEPEDHNVRTYRSGDSKTPEEEDDDRIKAQYGKSKPVLDKGVEASTEELERRRQEFLNKVRSMSKTPEPKKSSALDRLRQKFKIA